VSVAEDIAGVWVADKDMHPMMNIWHREWMTADGEMHGEYRGNWSIPPGARERGLYWRFPLTTMKD